MNYLTYEEYTSLGGVLDVTAFNRNIDRACSMIDNATFNRIHAMAEVPQRVKACCRDLVEYYATNSNTTEKGVASWSQSAGAVNESVSYVTQTAEDVQSAIGDIISDYLGSVTDDNGTPLLYLGARR